MVNIAIVDDLHLFRRAVANLLHTFKDVSVVLEAENGKSLLDQLKTISVDLVLMDIQMPEMNGYEACKALHKQHPEIKIMIVCELTTEECVRKVVELGANGFFSKKSNPDQLEEAIHLVMNRGYYFSKLPARFVLENHILENIRIRRGNYKSTNFTPQEIQVLRMACKELTSGEIADKLNINIRTVDTHRKKIMEKTGSKNFMGAVLFAVKNQYINLE